jgi:hypothetical protein
MNRVIWHTCQFLICTALNYGLVAASMHLTKNNEPEMDTQKAAIQSPEWSTTDRTVCRDKELFPAPDTIGYWIYLGRFSPKTNRWIHSNIDSPDLPRKGRQIITLTDLFKWNGLPCLTGNEWKMGRIMGLFPSSVTLEIMQVQKIRFEDYWALVRKTS